MLSPATSLRIVYRAVSKWSENGGTRFGAALSYYAIFSTAPLLLIAIHFSGMVYGEEMAHGKVHEQLENIVGEKVADSVKGLLKTAHKEQQEEHTLVATITSFALLVIAAVGAFLHVRTALSIIWQLEPPHGNTWLGVLWDYTLAVIMVFGVAILILCSLAASLAVPIAFRIVQEAHVPVELQWLEWGASFLFLTLMFAAVYRILSGGRIPWGYVLYGSFVAAILFTIGKTLLSYYIVYSGTESMYGAAGSIVVYMVWIYYSSQILFFGAELIQARRTRHDWMNEGDKPLAA